MERENRRVQMQKMSQRLNSVEQSFNKIKLILDGKNKTKVNKINEEGKLNPVTK